jgi:hypothetical protein
MKNEIVYFVTLGSISLEIIVSFLESTRFNFTTQLILRGIALVSVFAFYSLFLQVNGLIGKKQNMVCSPFIVNYVFIEAKEVFFL